MPRQDEGIAPLGQMRGRVHHALPGQVLAGLLERVHHRVGGCHSCGEVAVLQVTRVDARSVLLEDRLEELDPLVVAPDRCRGILAEHDRDRSIRSLLRHDRHQRGRRRDVVDEDLRLPVEPRDRVEGLQRELSEREDHQHVGLRGLELRHLRLNVRRGRVVTDARDDRLRLRAQPALEAGQQIAPVVIVLVEDGDLRFLHVLEDVAPVELTLLGVRWDVADRPRVLLVIASEGGRARGDVELRHLRVVQQLAHRKVVARSERAEHGEDLLLLNETDRVVDRATGVVTVVEIRERDLAAEHAPFVVDVFEVRVDPARDVAGDGGFAAQRNARAEMDLGGRDSGRRDRTRSGRRYGDRADDRAHKDDPRAHSHLGPSVYPTC